MVISHSQLQLLVNATLMERMFTGKERLYLEVARILKKKVYIGAAKLRLLRHLELPEEDMKWLTANEMESHVHVVPMWTLASFKRMKYAASQYSVRQISFSCLLPNLFICAFRNKEEILLKYSHKT